MPGLSWENAREAAKDYLRVWDINLSTGAIRAAFEKGKRIDAFVKLKLGSYKEQKLPKAKPAKKS
jgi:hypothetical protein